MPFFYRPEVEEHGIRSTVQRSDSDDEYTIAEISATISAARVATRKQRARHYGFLSRASITDLDNLRAIILQTMIDSEPDPELSDSAVHGQTSKIERHQTPAEKKRMLSTQLFDVAERQIPNRRLAPSRTKN